MQEQILLAGSTEKSRMLLHFCVWLDNQVNLTELSCTARLLFVAVVCARCFCDSLAVRDARLEEVYRNLLVVLDAPFQCAQVELALS